MRPFLPPSPTLSFNSFRSNISVTGSSASSSSALDPFNLRRRPSNRAAHSQSISSLASLLPPINLTQSDARSSAHATTTARRTHRRTATGSMGSAGAKAALKAASSMLPAGLRGMASAHDDLLLPFADKIGTPEEDEEFAHVANSEEEYSDADLSIESLFAAIWNFGCLLYLTSDVEPGVAPEPSAAFDSLRLLVLALVLLPLLLSLSSGARALSLREQSFSPLKLAGTWFATVASAVGIFVWSRYLTHDWSLSTPWLAYQALVLAIGIVGIVYNSVVRRTKGIEQHIQEAEPLNYYYEGSSSTLSSSGSQPNTPTRSSSRSTPVTSPLHSPAYETPRGASRENLVAMLA